MARIKTGKKRVSYNPYLITRGAMFKHLGKMVEKQVEKKAAKLEEEEEHKAMVAYLRGHGHDRFHSQVLIGTWIFIPQSKDRCSCPSRRTTLPLSNRLETSPSTSPPTSARRTRSGPLTLRERDSLLTSLAFRTMETSCYTTVRCLQFGAARRTSEIIQCRKGKGSLCAIPR